MSESIIQKKISLFAEVELAQKRGLIGHAMLSWMSFIIKLDLLFFLSRRYVRRCSLSFKFIVISVFVVVPKKKIVRADGLGIIVEIST